MVKSLLIMVYSFKEALKEMRHLDSIIFKTIDINFKIGQLRLFVFNLNFFHF